VKIDVEAWENDHADRFFCFTPVTAVLFSNLGCGYNDKDLSPFHLPPRKYGKPVRSAVYIPSARELSDSKKKKGYMKVSKQEVIVKKKVLKSFEKDILDLQAGMKALREGKPVPAAAGAPAAEGGDDEPVVGSVTRSSGPVTRNDMYLAAMPIAKRVDTNGGFKCSECSIVFKKVSTLEMHLLKHQGIGSYECADCDKYFSRKELLVSHMKIHFRGQFACDHVSDVGVICGATFSQKVGLVSHHEIKHNPEFQRFVCRFCADHSYTKKNDCTDHELGCGANQHRVELSCGFKTCDRVFYVKKRRDNHRRAIHKWTNF
jgi:hypothetical protein